MQTGEPISAESVKELKVNFDEIQKAMEDVARDTFDYFLDLETGEILTFSEEILREVKARLYEDDAEEISDEVEYIEFDEEPEIPDWMEDEVELALEILFDTKERYPRIPERTSAAAYQSMVEFIEAVDDTAIRVELSAALDGKGAFRKFKDILLDYPKDRKKWHGYNTKAIKKETIEWLRSLGVEPIF